MEEYRTQRSTWIHALTQRDIDFMVNHIGADSIAVAGFFVGPHYDASNKKPRICLPSPAQVPRSPSMRSAHERADGPLRCSP